MALVLEDALMDANGTQEATQGRAAGQQTAPAAENGQHKTPGGLLPTGGSNVNYLAEREGFEPSVSLPTLVFKTSTINHSVTSAGNVLGLF